MNGEIHFHEPMRPLAIIESPIERVQGIIDRHEKLQQLFNNHWVNLLAVDPILGVFQEYQGNGRWESLNLKISSP
jgi:hypothetical protein